MSKRFGRKQKRIYIKSLEYEWWRINEINSAMTMLMRTAINANSAITKELQAFKDANENDIKIVDKWAKEIFG